MNEIHSEKEIQLGTRSIFGRNNMQGFRIARRFASIFARRDDKSERSFATWLSIGIHVPESICVFSLEISRIRSIHSIHCRVGFFWRKTFL